MPRGAGSPTNGSTASPTIAAPIEISTVVASGSSPRLMAAFQPAWQAAANSTAVKTKESIAQLGRHREAAKRPARTISGAGDSGAAGFGRRGAAAGQNGYFCLPVAIVIQRSSVKCSIAALPPKRP